ncbi:hypothetical protein Goshw_010285, partial [Gossypium schwendimanii]|nr:hypothetical protein [Gossypium schwendimanii]
MALSRPFVDYCIWGWDNLPRKVLMYYTNFLSSPEGYFHTVICNAKAFSNTTVNNDLHFILWDNPPKQHPRRLTLSHMQWMLNSNAPFARKFHQNSRVLDKVDTDLLSRGKEMFTPGGWCVGSGENGTDPCSVVGTPTVLRPGPGAKSPASSVLPTQVGKKSELIKAAMIPSILPCSEVKELATGTELLFK